MHWQRKPTGENRMKLTAQKELGANTIINEQGEVVATVVDVQTAKLMAAAPVLANAALLLFRALQEERSYSSESSRLRADVLLRVVEPIASGLEVSPNGPVMKSYREALAAAGLLPKTAM
jgi:hypothetical protein